MYEITELNDDQCRFALTAESPHFFCGEPIERGAYCSQHAKRCYTGTGKPWQSLAAMMDATEQTVAHITVRDEDVQPSIDDVFSNSQIGGRPLMERL